MFRIVHKFTPLIYLVQISVLFCCNPSKQWRCDILTNFPLYDLTILKCLIFFFFGKLWQENMYYIFYIFCRKSIKFLWSKNNQFICVNYNVTWCILLHNIVNYEIIFHVDQVLLFNIWILWAEAHYRKTKVQKHKYVGLYSNFISCFKCLI